MVTDAMTPQDFKEFVFKQLTLEERESLMVDEKQRRKTFLTNWPHGSSLKPIRMAQCGFYSVGMLPSTESHVSGI